MSFKVNLIYYKATGKYYSEGSYTSEKDGLYEIWSEVGEMLKKKSLPGLVDGHSEFIVSVDVPEHPNRHPHLMNVREALRQHDEFELQVHQEKARRGR